MSRMSIVSCASAILLASATLGCGENDTSESGGSGGNSEAGTQGGTGGGVAGQGGVAGAAGQGGTGGAAGQGTGGAAGQGGASPTCNSTNCPSPRCCDANGVCQPGTADNACSLSSKTECLNCPEMYGVSYICQNEAGSASGCGSRACGPGQPACEGCCDYLEKKCYPGDADDHCGTSLSAKGIPGACMNCTLSDPVMHCVEHVAFDDWFCQ
jgi:hypothetical protein